MTARNIIWFKNFPNGRFGNSIFQFIFAKYAECALHCDLIFGETTELALHGIGYLLSIGNQDAKFSLLNGKTIYQTLFIGEQRTTGPDPDLNKIEQHFRDYPNTVLVVDGYFQYDTKFFTGDDLYSKLFHEYISPHSDNKRTNFQSAVAAYIDQLDHISDGYFVGAHIRRGDYVDHHKDGNLPYFYTIDLEKCTYLMKEYLSLNRISKPIVYIASDDIIHCNGFFQANGINSVTRKYFTNTLVLDEINEMLIDMAVLIKSQVLICSNSSFSIICSLLNRRARTFLRPKLSGDFVSFDPRNTTVLYGL